ncbi:oligosaccharide flippase family protein [Aureibaculum luteum]|uniref:oligosaccharide flippase family protein n=1 Tax=Aureibaculum luteum TaxID=1548456 RepID=UPI000E4FB669|nr:polysaccharide biosynthesis C-terminal domain-containing protein [Aureibaculum luteum]
MIDGLKDLLSGFRNRNGMSIFYATILARILSFFTSWIALQLIDHKDLGVVIYAFTLISFIIPISGLGLHQSLIRYGSLSTSDTTKNQIFKYVLNKGLISSIVLVLIIILISLLFKSYFLNGINYLIILSFAMPTFFLLEIVKVQYRLKHQNKTFAFVEVSYNILLIILVTILSYTYKELGYTIALVIAPLLTSVLFIKKLNIDFKIKVKPDIINFGFWKYGFFASLSNVATKFLTAIDIILIGYLLKNSEMVTVYKYISLIPLSLLFISQVFITTDFVNLTENIYNKNYIKKYIKNYMFLFAFISICIGFSSWLFAEDLLLFFGTEFINYKASFLVLILGAIGILILRGLYGNLLSIIGKANINYYIAISAIVLNVILNYYLIPNYGIFGAALTSTLLMWITGIISCFAFYKLYKKFLVHQKLD